MSDADATEKREMSPEQLLVLELAKKLYVLHGKLTSGSQVAWRGATSEERKLWLNLAKRAIPMVRQSELPKA